MLKADVAPAFFPQLLEHLGQCLHQLLAVGGSANKSGQPESLVGDVEGGGVAVCGVGCGVGVHLLQPGHICLGAQQGCDNDFARLQSFLIHFLTEHQADVVKQVFGRLGEVGDGVGQFIDVVVFAGTDFLQ